LAGLPTVAASSVARSGRHAFFAIVGYYARLARVRLSGLVAATAATGFVLGTSGDLDWARLAWMLLGTTLAAWGANAFNQWIEMRRDARMHRTRRRPLPTRSIRARSALAFAVVTGLAGPALLAARINSGAAGLVLAALLIYVLAYTPLKVRTPLSTVIGGVVGALPPLVGWMGAVGRLDGAAWILGVILFLWQIPHALALAWLYREDYRRGGFRLLPVVDDAAARTGRLIVLYVLVLVLASVQMTVIGVTGRAYAVGALLLGAGLLLASVMLERRPSRAAARRLFLATVIYLPALLILMVIDRRPC
jgi:protoheme IX farnesyltransferase